MNNAMKENMQMLTIREFNKVVKSKKLKAIVNQLLKQDPSIRIYYGMRDCAMDAA